MLSLIREIAVSRPDRTSSNASSEAEVLREVASYASAVACLLLQVGWAPGPWAAHAVKAQQNSLG